ncbi:hypothetical protein BOX15_Mlig001527g1 [Macrostomum lignano]|uniref:FCP1 homology domain-containing protein n=3 Tax=Macrostomum lignano TaxID=282301 RepID=A0A1I8GR70_9PLAT|nr:hypothetical protein BOX15_Mlig001527g1 [Macrostomum lignano]
MAHAVLNKDPWRSPRLVVWDVNDTIVMGNIDDAVAGLLPSERRHALNASQKNLGWSGPTYMTHVMSTLQEYRIGRWAVESLIRSLPLHRLMVDAVREMYRERVVQVIISNTNVAFLHTFLEHYGLLDHFAVIFANEANWKSSSCDSSLEVIPMHPCSEKELSICQQCNYQQTGICCRTALRNILQYLHLLEARIALVQTSWGLCASHCLKPTSDLILSRVGNRTTRQRADPAAGAEHAGEADATIVPPQVKYQHGEDLINILRQPVTEASRANTGLLPTEQRELESFLQSATHYFDDTRICNTTDKRICRKYPH